MPVYSDLAEVFAPNSNQPIPLATVNQSPLSWSSEGGHEELTQNPGTVLQAALRVGLVLPVGFLASRFNGFIYSRARDNFVLNQCFF